jgi:hypothetical protein
LLLWRAALGGAGIALLTLAGVGLLLLAGLPGLVALLINFRRFVSHLVIFALIGLIGHYYSSPVEAAALVMNSSAADL